MHTHRLLWNWWLFSKVATTSWVQWSRHWAGRAGGPRVYQMALQSCWNMCRFSDWMEGSRRVPPTQKVQGCSQPSHLNHRVLEWGQPSPWKAVPPHHFSLWSPNIIIQTERPQGASDKTTKQSCDPALAVKSGILKNRPGLLKAWLLGKRELFQDSITHFLDSNRACRSLSLK